jgi:hypothetical protein
MYVLEGSMMRCLSHMQLIHLDDALRRLRPLALDIFHLLGYVSLNTAALRKILKKYAKNVEPTAPQPGSCSQKSSLFSHLHYGTEHYLRLSPAGVQSL